MKTVTLAVIAFSFSIIPTFSQGFIDFFAGLSAATRMSTNSLAGEPATGVTAANTTSTPLYYYAMFASSSESSINGSSAAITGFGNNYVFNFLGGGTASTGWVLVGMATNTAQIGVLLAMSQGTDSANQVALNSDGSLTVQGIAGAQTAYIVVDGWSADLGTSLKAMEQGYYFGYGFGQIGQSAIATVTLGDGLSTPTPSPFGLSAGRIPGFVMGYTDVPEPSTFALSALGCVSLLIFHRKK